MSAPRTDGIGNGILPFGQRPAVPRPAERADSARLARANACRSVSERTRRTMRQRATHPSFVVTATTPMKPHPTDAANQITAAVKDARGTGAEVMALPNALREFALGLSEVAARTLGALVVEHAKAHGEVQVTLAAAFADGQVTAHEARGIAHAVRPLRDLLDELVQAAEQHARGNGWTPGGAA